MPTAHAEQLSSPRVCIVAEHASVRFGGEAILPYHYFRRLRERGIEAWLVVHARTRNELLALMPQEAERLRFVPDTWLHKALWAVGRPLPGPVRFITTGFALRLLTQLLARREVRRLVREQGVQVVHEPIPVSPRNPSLMFGLGAPVVVGPLNGGMSFPPAFRDRGSALDRAAVRFGRSLTGIANFVIPGKRRAEIVLVANGRTRAALMPGIAGHVLDMVENGVDLTLWEPATGTRAPGPVRFVFLGRLVALKAVDLLLEAFVPVAREFGAMLEILGDGPARPGLEAASRRLGLEKNTRFCGFVAQTRAAEQMRASDVFVLPSLHECGGAVVLEAMACGLPVIVTNWGGPADYVTAECGVLVDPSGRDGFVAGLTAALRMLAGSPELRARLGEAGRRRVREAGFDWEDKITQILQVYRQAAGR